MTVSEFLVDFLIEHGVTDVFGIPGGVILDLLYAFDSRKEIRAHLSYHEQNAAFEACGYAQLKHQLGVAYATRGPGFTNLITGIADAYSDSLPVFFVTAHAAKQVGHSMRYEQEQTLDTVSMVRHITKYAVSIDNISSVCHEIRKAYTAATSGRKGPVLLDFSSDLWRKEVHFQDSDNTIVPPTPSCNMDEILKRIIQAKRPLVLVGDGVRQSNTVDMVKQLIKKMRIPIVSSRAAQDVGAACANYYGYIGSHGIRYSNFIFSKADLVISFGNRLAFPLNSHSFQKAIGNKQFIRMEIDETELKRNVPNSFADLCDLYTFLSQILEKDIHFPEWSAWITTCDELKAALHDIDIYPAIDKISMVMQFITKDINIVCDVGNNEFWVSQSYERSGIENRILYSKSFGTLGCGLGKAIGAYYADLKPVICFVGDQGIQLSIQELELIACEKIPVVVIILNDSCSGMIRDREKRKYGEKYIHTTKCSGYGSPDFSLIAQSYQIKYLRYVEGLDLSILKNIREPLILEIFLDESMELLPFLPKGNPMQKMYPELDEEFYSKLDSM